MAIVAAVPAIAQVTQHNDQATRSGDSSQTITSTGGGDNSSACQMIQGVNNTGNALNNTSVLQYASDGKVGVGGVGGAGNFTISPKQNEGVAKVCEQKVQQAASAAGDP